MRIPCEVTASAARAVWRNNKIVDDITSDALQILAKASGINLRFFTSKAPKCLLGGLFYLLGWRYNVARTQREIANMLGTTEVSIRKAYKNWLKEFPQFFKDITVKMETRKNNFRHPALSCEETLTK
jgi:transcription initiation factor TFIIIB Brf1 subunit/transcription initiation factor TFIIB